MNSIDIDYCVMGRLTTRAEDGCWFKLHFIADGLRFGALAFELDNALITETVYVHGRPLGEAIVNEHTGVWALAAKRVDRFSYARCDDKLLMEVGRPRRGQLN